MSKHPIWKHILDAKEGYITLASLFDVARILPACRARKLVQEAHNYGLISRQQMVCWLATVYQEAV
jgi:hypothetical protein